MLSLWLGLNLLLGATAFGAGECKDFGAPDYRSLCVCDPGTPATPSTPETPDTLNYTKTRNQFRQFLTSGDPALKKNLGNGAFLQLTSFNSEPAKSAWTTQLGDLIPSYLDNPADPTNVELPVSPSPPMDIAACVAKADSLFLLSYQINQQIISWMEMVGPSVKTAKGVIRTQNVTPGAEAISLFEPMGPKQSTLPRVLKLYGGKTPSSVSDPNVALREYLAKVARLHTHLRIGGSEQVARITGIRNQPNDPQFPGLIQGSFVDLLQSKKNDVIDIPMGYGWSPAKYCGKSTFSSGVCVLANDFEKVLAASDGTFPMNLGCGTKTFSTPYCTQDSTTKKFHQAELRGAMLTQIKRVGQLMEDSIRLYGKVPSLKDFGLAGGITEFPDKLKAEVQVERQVIKTQYDSFFKTAMAKASTEAQAYEALECTEFSNIAGEVGNRKTDRLQIELLDNGKKAIKSSGAQGCTVAALQAGDLNRTALLIKTELDYLVSAIVESYRERLSNQ